MRFRRVVTGFLLPVLAAILIVFLFHKPVLMAVANYVMVADPLVQAHAIAVLAGSEVSRCRTAATLFKEGRAPRILITKGRYPDQKRELERYGIPAVESHEKCIAILRFHNVPETAVETVDGYNESTADEAVTLRRYLEKQGAKRVLVVTSNFHTRRARLILRRTWRNNGVQLAVQPAPPDSLFDPDGWWTRRGDIKVLFWEYQKLLFYTLLYW